MRCIALRWLLSFVTVLMTVMPAASQTPVQKPSFEVASIKPDPDWTSRPRAPQTASPDRLQLECITLQALVEYAYGVWADAANPNPRHPNVRGGSGWVNSEHYTITATATGNSSRGEMNGPMLRALLKSDSN